MNKFFISLLAVSIVFGVSTTVFAELYVSGSLAIVTVNDSDFSDGFDAGKITYDNGVGFSAALGGLAGDTRLEIEFAHKKNDFDSFTIYGLGTADIPGDVTVDSIMCNGYVDFPSSGNFAPFIGAGFGFAEIEASINGLGSDDDSVVAYQLMVGGSFSSSDDLFIDIQYRLFGTEDPDFDGLEAEYTAHNFMIGLRKSF